MIPSEIGMLSQSGITSILIAAASVSAGRAHFSGLTVGCTREVARCPVGMVAKGPSVTWGDC
jgi:hypothetical protein